MSHSWFEDRAFWVRCLIAGGVGVAGALSQAPFDYAFIIVVMMILGFVFQSGVTRGRQAAVLGLSLGLGYFSVTLSWIIAPFQVDPATVWMAPFGLFFMALGMALFWAFAFWAATALRARWALIITWTGAELLRAYVFTGFPWGSPPQALIDVLSGQALAWVGPHGVMLGLCALGWFATLDAKRYLLAQAAAFALIAPVVFFPADWLAPHPVGEDRPIIRLVQPNAPQHEKWEADKRWTFVREGLDQTRAPGDPDLILWPETSIPTLLHNADTVVQALGEAAGETPVAFGILRLEESGLIANSLLVADASGQISQTYDKHHLVPFGEYMPLRRVFNAVGLRFIGDMFGDGFARGTGAQLLDFGPLGTALPLICYEAVFAHDVGSAPERPDFLIQVTNDAWFGDFAGPQQHLAQARMRAIEQGLPMARAANTGISAMIDPYGRITAFVGLNETGFVDAALPAPRKATLYRKTGDKPLATLLFLVAMMCLFGRIRAGAARKS